MVPLVMPAHGDDADISQAADLHHVTGIGTGDPGGVGTVPVAHHGHVPARFLLEDGGVSTEQPVQRSRRAGRRGLHGELDTASDGFLPGDIHVQHEILHIHQMPAQCFQVDAPPVGVGIGKQLDHHFLDRGKGGIARGRERRGTGRSVLVMLHRLHGVAGGGKYAHGRSQQ